MANSIEESNIKLEKEIKKKKRKNILIIILIIIIFLIPILLYVAGYRIGKIGYEKVSSNLVSSIEITENEIEWGKIVDLDIFSNPEFDNKKMIAPKSTSTYKFAIENKTNKQVVYNILMNETNEFNINMKYKLKLDNVYIIGDETTFVDVDEMNLNNIIVMPNSTNLYTLEWYWEEDENDTSIGERAYAEYKLNIKIDSQYY